ncbi:hypothetical protein TYRP_013011 [Tyrophagus putrescentiae]|nr:hypothetical protein TYRP_013011 [Tyrophagus putrescentiae]
MPVSRQKKSRIDTGSRWILLVVRLRSSSYTTGFSEVKLATLQLGGVTKSRSAGKSSLGTEYRLRVLFTVVLHLEVHRNDVSSLQLGELFAQSDKVLVVDALDDHCNFSAVSMVTLW